MCCTKVSMLKFFLYDYGKHSAGFFQVKIKSTEVIYRYGDYSTRPPGTLYVCVHNTNIFWAAETIGAWLGAGLPRPKKRTRIGSFFLCCGQRPYSVIVSFRDGFK